MDGVKHILDKLRESSIPTAEGLYHQYLEKHISRVMSVYEDIIKPVLAEDGISEDILEDVERLISTHDRSKYDEEEFIAYKNYFYDKENHPRSTEEFSLAWNRHQKHNPHHWQYWCLINDVDEPQVQPLNIPFQYIIEMLCDWQSAGEHYGNTAYDWYMKQKDKMILTDKTREIIERYIQYLK